MHVALVSTIRNRAWILYDWLEALGRIQQPGQQQLTMIFLDDASDDTTTEQLECFVKNRDNSILLRNTSPFDPTATSSRHCKDRKALYQHLADNRNRLIDEVLTIKADWMFSLDSDILPSPTILRSLLMHPAFYVSSIVNNTRTITVDDVKLGVWRTSCNIMNEDGAYEPVRFRHIRPVRLNRLEQVDLSGACFLVKASLLAQGARFSFHSQGEDGGFCLALARMNIPRYCDTTPRCVHVLQPKDLPQAKETYTNLCPDGVYDGRH